jgi:hypothetical protein
MKHENEIMAEAHLADDFAGSARRVLAVDVEKYQAYLDGSGLSPEQKEEILQSLWLIMMSFVELGFGVHPLQEVCGKDDLPCTRRAKASFDEVKSTPSDTNKKSTDSGPPGGLEVE